MIKVLAWTATIAGSALYLFGYFGEPGQTLINWANLAPSWIAEFLPNRAAEYGVVIYLAGNALMYLPAND